MAPKRQIGLAELPTQPITEKTSQKDLKDPRGPKVRRWTITFWDDPREIAKKLLPRLDYFITGREICPTTNREHWQSYVEFKSRTYRMTAVKMFNLKCSFLVSRGDGEANEKYCTKDKTDLFELGTISPDKGHRSDIESFKAELDTQCIHEVMDHSLDLYCRYRNGLNDYHRYAMKKKVKFNEVIHHEVQSHDLCQWKDGLQNFLKENIGSTFLLEGIAQPDDWGAYNGESILVIKSRKHKNQDQDLSWYVQTWPIPLKCKYKTLYPAWSQVWNFVYIYDDPS